MKSGYCTIMWNGRHHGAGEMNHHQPHQRPVFIQRRWCCVYGGIGRESSIMSSFRKNQTINSNKYYSQLDQHDEKQQELVNRKCIIFHQDNARPHVSRWPDETVTAWLGSSDSSAYSPDIAPSDFHLFQSLQNSLNGKNFNSPEDCKRHLEQFFAQKDKKFWEDGIMKMPEKWQKVVEQKGEYIVQ